MGKLIIKTKIIIQINFQTMLTRYKNCNTNNNNKEKQILVNR